MPLMMTNAQMFKFEIPSMSEFYQLKKKKRQQNTIQQPSHNPTVVDRNLISIRCGELNSIPTPTKGG